MKKSILGLLIVILIFVFFTGCEEDKGGLSIDDRIKEFAKDLNNPDRTAMIKEHFHPTGSYSGMNDSTLKNDFHKGSGYYATTSGSGSSRSVTIYGPAAKPNWTFYMKEDGKDNWKIDSYN